MSIRVVLAVVAMFTACTKVPAGPCPESPPSTVRHLPFDLPRTSAGGWAPPVAPAPGVTVPEQTPVLVVTITRTGELLVHDRAASLDDLRTAARQSGTEVRAIIRADRQASWGRVVLVFDALKQAGISRLAFAVEAGQPGR